MLVKKAEIALTAVLREYMYLEGSGCAREIELRGKLTGMKEALALARLVKEDRFQELYASAHLEVHGMTMRAKSLSIGVPAQQLTMADWERFETPTVIRRQGA
jgi:hypothetical protein